MKKRFEVWVNDGAGARKLCHFPTEYGAERKAEEVRKSGRFSTVYVDYGYYDGFYGEVMAPVVTSTLYQTI